MPSTLAEIAIESISHARPCGSVTEINGPRTSDPVTVEDAGIGFTLDELEQRLRRSPVSYIIDGLLPASDVHVAVGDSGLGKTPWAYQLGLCVAAGKPFLGHEVRPSRVLYFDMENGSEEILQVSRALCGHLGVKPFPQDFFVIPNDGSMPSLESAVRDRKPELVIVDTLRALHPEAERDNSSMGNLLQGFRRIARENNCAILLMHHTRKPSELGNTKALEDAPPLEWLLQAAGARALINQTNTRIALDKRKTDQREDVSLVMKSFVKVKGESGTIFLERAHDPHGEPIGYSRLVGVGLLGNSEQEAAFENLPNSFRFMDAKRIYGKSDNPTAQWLKKCESAGLIRRVGHGSYGRT